MNEKYLEAVKTIKTAVLRSQSRAAKYTNIEMLSLYYVISGYVSDNSRVGTWSGDQIDSHGYRFSDEGFLGNQHRIEVDGEEFFADLLFFQRDLKALVVIELKKD